MTNFQINVRVDRAILSHRLALGPTVFPIHIRIGSNSFPDANWDDFGLVILAWWLEVAVPFVNGFTKSAVLRFMDGPFELRMASHGNGECSLAGIIRHDPEVEAFRDIALTKDVLEAIVRASIEALAAHQSAGCRSQDYDALKALVDGRQ